MSVAGVAVLAGCGGSSSGGNHAALPATPTYESLSGGYPVALSADGSVIVGSGQNVDYAFPLIWNGATTPVGLPAGDLSFDYAQAVSSDGSTLLGIRKQPDNSFRAVLYTVKKGYVEVPLPKGATMSYSVALSGDAKVIACDDAPPTNPYTPRPFVVRNGTATYLPLPSGATTGMVGAVSQDGSTVVGTAGGLPVRWVGNGAPEALSSTQGEAVAVNRDGTVVVGLLFEAGSGWKPFRWTASGGIQDLPTAVNFRYGQASGVSADGKTVLLNAQDLDQDNREFVYLWQEGVGTRPLADLFAAVGGTPAFTGSDAVALSSSGKVIIGRSMHSISGDIVGAWRLTLP